MIKVQDRVTALWRDAINLVLGIWLVDTLSEIRQVL